MAKAQPCIPPFPPFVTNISAPGAIPACRDMVKFNFEGSKQPAGIDKGGPEKPEQSRKDYNNSIMDNSNLIFTTGQGSVYYYSQSKNIALRFKYATGKVYCLNYPQTLYFKNEKTSDVKNVPTVGYCPHEDFGGGQHQGHEVTGVGVQLTNSEQGVIQNLNKLTAYHIYDMADVFGGNYSKGAQITDHNQTGTPYTRS